jgi:hypothetical protein
VIQVASLYSKKRKPKGVFHVNIYANINFATYLVLVLHKYLGFALGWTMLPHRYILISHRVAKKILWMFNRNEIKGKNPHTINICTHFREGRDYIDLSKSSNSNDLISTIDLKSVV